MLAPQLQNILAAAVKAFEEVGRLAGAMGPQQLHDVSLGFQYFTIRDRWQFLPVGGHPQELLPQAHPRASP